AITGKEDFEECRQLLAHHHWDLQIAVQDALNQAEGRGDVYQEEQRDVSTDSDQELIENEPPGPIIEPAPMGWSNWLLNMASFPFTFTLSVITDLYRFIVGLVGRSLFGADTTALEDVLKFKEEFETKYGGTHPTFYQGSYSQAIEDAKKELRFLLVYLHSSEHKDTEQFCRSTLTNEGLQDYINGNMLFWAADVQSREGYRVGDGYGNCQINLTQLGCESEINAQSNLEKIVSRLPRHLQAEWAKEAFAILEKGKVPTFLNLTSFIIAKAKLASSAFGQLIGSKPQEDIAAAEIQRNQNFESRKAFVLKEKLYNICFGKGHFAKQCRKRDNCMVAECGQRHHSLLHPVHASIGKGIKDEPEKKVDKKSVDGTSNGQCGVTGPGRPGVRLRVLPAKVREMGETEEIETYALLDDGSDVSLCDSNLVKQLGITG
ncbi:Hypothetical predicted protein, partial [Paramuricea clavata]